MEKTNTLDWITLVLVIIGAINWGLLGIGYFVEANLNVVNQIFAGALGLPVLENIIYILVGLSGIYQIYFGYKLAEG